MILADTSVWIDYLRGSEGAHVDKLDRLLGEEEIILGDLMLFELLQGVRDDHDHRVLSQQLDRLTCFDLVGQEVARAAAEYHRSLRARGITIRKVIDLFIGTFSILNEVALLHNDRDFDVMERHLGLVTA